MVDIYICEDDKMQRTLLERYIQNAILINEYDMELRLATDNLDDVIKNIKQSENTGLYFLDIDLKLEKNGLMLAKEIREYDPRGFIVFVTSHSEMSYLTFQYKVEALDFIIKDEPRNIQGRVCECMENVIRRYANINKRIGKTFTIIRQGRKQILKYEEIMFFETSINEHKIVVHTENRSLEFFGKMKDIESEVGNEFLRSHRAYLINKKNIKEVNYPEKTIIMKNNMGCPISYRLLNHVKDCM